MPRVVKEMPSVALGRDEFARRFRARFADPLFDGVGGALDAVVDAAWRSYSEHHKDALRVAELQHRDSALPARVLVVNGSARSEHSCPGESSKTFRLAKLAQAALEDGGASVDFLDLSVLTS